MALQTLNPNRSKRKNRKNIDEVQREFPGAYVSTVANSRRNLKTVSDATNMELVSDNVWRPRPPLKRYGKQPAFPVVGRGKYRWQGVRGLLWVFNISGHGVIYRQVNGGDFILVGGDLDVTKWTMFCQSKGKVYPFNASNALQYIQLSDWTTHTYTALTTPNQPTVTASANLVSGTKPYDYYYRVSANNEVGESIASQVSASANVNTVRESWSSETSIAKTVAITWTAVVGATSYTLYVGDSPLTLKELVTVTSLSYTDDGKLQTNPFKLAPEGNSTAGFIPAWLYNDAKNAQMFGIEALTNKLYYSAPGTGDFSAYNGGGWVTIDEDGDTELNFCTGFRDGKGEPVITTSSRGAAGKGLMDHVTFKDLTVGDQVISYPDVYPASGQSGTYAPRATLMSRDSITYPTGDDFKTTGTSQNIMNILTTNRVDQMIEPDTEKINISALSGACGEVYRDREYYCLPVGSSSNNEIWIRDRSRKDVWILRWTVAARDIWLYEDSFGATHLCVLVGNVILEFTRKGATLHTDDGVPFRSRLAYDAMTWDEAGICLGKIRTQHIKVLNPKGRILAKATGLTRRGVSQAVGADEYTTTTTPTGYDIWLYDEHVYDEDPGSIGTFGKSIGLLTITPRGLLAQESWELLGEDAGTDYILSSVRTRGWYSEDLTMKIK
jgi:hypothetical protein